MTPQKALQFLQEGNERFLNNLRLNRNLLQLVNETADKQFPFAAILSCSDSRLSNELIFDQGLGDIFSVRLAGNIATKYAIASLEFAVENLGSKIVVVLGHTGCGAVKAACEGKNGGNLDSILEFIRPAIRAEKKTLSNRTPSNDEFLENVMRLNIRLQIKNIVDNSSILRERIHSGNILLAGAKYDVKNGMVSFLNEINETNIEHEIIKVYEG
jgi:carbonic anhydrase